MQKEICVELLLEYKSGERYGIIDIIESAAIPESSAGSILYSYNVVHR